MWGPRVYVRERMTSYLANWVQWRFALHGASKSGRHGPMESKCAPGLRPEGPSEDQRAKSEGGVLGEGRRALFSPAVGSRGAMYAPQRSLWWSPYCKRILGVFTSQNALIDTTR